MKTLVSRLACCIALVVSTAILPVVLPTAAQAGTTAGSFSAVATSRVLSTATGVGAPKAALAAGATLTFTVGGRAGVPATGSPAVVMTMTVTQPGAAGGLTVFAAGTTRPATTNLSFGASQTVSNTVVVQTSAAGAVSVYNSATSAVQISADVTGFYRTGPATGAGAFTVVTPARVQNPTGIAAKGSLTVQVGGKAGVPATNVAVAMLDVTVVSPTTAGSVTAYPTGATRPDSLTVAFAAGPSVTNLGAIRLQANTGRITLYNNSSKTVQVAVDAVGYVTAGTPSTAGAFTKTAPAVLLDTRSGAPFTANQTRDVQVTGAAGVPGTGVAAVVVNVSSLQAGAAGALTVFPTGAARPATLTTVFGAGRTTANLAVITLGAGGRISVYNASAGTTHVQLEVVGWISTTPMTWTAPTRTHPPAGPLSAVSCAAVTFCAAVDASGWAVQYNGTSWTAPRQISTDALTAVSCAKGSAFCVAVDSAGVAFRLNGTTWSAGTPINANDGITRLTGVSCTSTTWCVAVDNLGRAASYNGTTWTAFVGVDSNEGLTGVSCTSATNCVAVDDTGHGVTFNGAGWTEPTTLFTSGNPVAAVSCPGPTFCSAITSQGEVSIFNGTTWTPGPALGDAAPVADLSCVSATSCVATGDFQTAWRYNGTSWASAGNVAFLFTADAKVSCVTTTFCMGVASTVGAVYNGTDWNGDVIDEEHAGVVGISCASATFCTSLDSRSVVRFNGTSWTRPTIIGHLDTPSGNTDYATSVSCPTGTFCEVGVFSGDPGAGFVSGVRWDGTNWTAEQFGLIGGQYAALVSCPTAGSCVAVASDRYGVYTSGAWSFSDDAITDNQLTTLSCASSTFCIATDDTGSWQRFNGTVWTAAVPVGITPTALSCVSATFCIAVDNTGRHTTFNGTSWAAPTVIDPGKSLTSVSCASSSFCIAVDADGRALQFNGTGWSTPTVIDAGHRLTGVSCPTAQFCAAVDEGGYSVIGRA